MKYKRIFLSMVVLIMGLAAVGCGDSEKQIPENDKAAYEEYCAQNPAECQ